MLNPRPTLQNLPGPRGHWLLGALPWMRRDMLGFFEQCFREHGDIAYFRLGRRRAILLSDPEAIEQVLVTENRRFIKNYGLQFLKPLLGNGLLLNEGDAWLRQRRIVQPAFARPRVETYATAMVECTERMLATWRDGEERDIAADMLRLAMEIAGRTLLGIDVTGRFSEMTRHLEAITGDFLNRFAAALPLPDWVPTPANRRLQATVRKLEALLQALIDERRASGQTGGDFLSLLMAARDEQDGRGISDKQIRDEVMTMFLAGHETTANALAWSWYLLAQNPAEQNRIRDEASRVIAGSAPSIAEVPQLVHTEHVLREAMRLYPPAYVIGRRPIEDCTINGYFLPAGHNVLMSQWVVHRDPRWYDDPLAFRPDRWVGDHASKIPKYAYFPFGGGPRVCIGNTFATFEATLILAMIARRFKLQLVSNKPIRILPAVTLRPAEPIRVRVERHR